jgi:hypothetical protein
MTLAEVESTKNAIKSLLQQDFSIKHSTLEFGSVRHDNLNTVGCGRAGHI